MLQQTVDVDLGQEASAPGWDRLVAAHGTRVYRHALRLTGNRADAEDLTQDAFVRVFRSLQTYEEREGGSFEGWLHRVTTNLFLDQVRRRARLRIDPLGEWVDDLGSTPSAQDLALPGTFDADVEQALSTLPPEFRAPVLLADVDGLSYEEVAAVLGLKLGTVRSRIHRGRARLRGSLAHRAPTADRVRYAGPRDLAPLPWSG